MIDWGDSFFDKEVEGEVEHFVGSVGMGNCCNGVMEGCEVVLRCATKDDLHLMGMVDLLQGMYPLDWDFSPS